MAKVRFLLIGGFLGAGKTTLIARLARHYLDRGLRVGVVTNDQAQDLVDTHALRAEGFAVGEVTGACFCCKFNDLIATAESLGASGPPDIIIAEPVGSCTDLMATVIEPLRRLYGSAYELGPLAVILKPEHGRKILAERPGSGFSPKAAYIFLKQLEEAQLIVLNKIDVLSEPDRAELVDLLHQRFPAKKSIALSARTGEGLDALIAALDTSDGAEPRTLDIDYDTYAEGEAELGWLNATVALEGREFDLDQLLLSYVEQLATALQSQHAEPAHLKVLAEAGDHVAIANLVSSTAPAELSRASGARVSNAVWTVNARVSLAPTTLREIITRTIEQLTVTAGLQSSVNAVQSFRPGRPVPTHRLAIDTPA